MTEHEDSFPLGIEDEVPMVNSAIAAEASEAFERHGNWETVVDDPEIWEKVGGLETPEMMYAAGFTNERGLELRDMINARIQELVASGLTEQEARHKVKAEVLEAFVKGQQDKDKEE
jgi:hypothetical protein